MNKGTRVLHRKLVGTVALLGIVSLALTGCGGAGTTSAAANTVGTPAAATASTHHTKGKRRLVWQLLMTPTTPKAGQGVSLQVTLASTTGKVPSGTMTAALIQARKHGSTVGANSTGSAAGANTTSGTGSTKSALANVTLQSKQSGVYTGTVTLPAQPGHYRLVISLKLATRTLHHSFLVKAA